MSDVASDGLDLGRPVDPRARKSNPFTVTLVVLAVLFAVLSLIVLRVAFGRLDLLGESSPDEVAAHFTATAVLASGALLLGALALVLAGVRWIAEHTPASTASED